MSRLDTLRRIVREKEVEIARLEAELAAAREFARRLEASVEELERRTEVDSLEDEPADPIVEVRAVIRAAGRPLYIDDVLRALGRPISRAAREDLRALLQPWLRRGEVFTRPRPSTFGLVEGPGRKQAPQRGRAKKRGGGSS